MDMRGRMQPFWREGLPKMVVVVVVVRLELMPPLVIVVVHWRNQIA